MLCDPKQKHQKVVYPYGSLTHFSSDVVTAYLRMDVLQIFDSGSESDSSSASEVFSDDFEEEELFEDRPRPKNENYLQETVLQFTENEFIEHFRISRAVANDIAVRFEQSDLFNYQSGGNDKVSARNQVYIFLWFAGHEAASFRDVADRFNITISSLFRISRRLIYFLSNLAPEVIQWPNLVEKQEIERFFRRKGFPGVIGALDGSHVRIDKPTRDPDSYYNRKKFFSIQLQVVCDNERRIRSLFVGFPGSVHDARVFRRSPLSQELEEKCGDYFILADSAYSCSRHLITPFRDRGNLSNRQKLFNRRISRSRYIIEHCFGLLKQKFRQLYHCKLRSIQDTVNFIRACCVLHNLSINDELVADAEYQDENEPVENNDVMEINDDDLEIDAPEGVAFRDYLLRTLDL